MEEESGLRKGKMERWSGKKIKCGRREWVAEGKDGKMEREEK